MDDARPIYADSLAGDLPPDWEVHPLEDVVFFQEGPGIRNWQYVDDFDGVPFVNIRCLVNGSLDRDAMNKVSREEAMGKYSHFLLDKDDYVVSSSGTLGRLASVKDSDLPCMLNTSVIRFRPRNQRVNRLFLKYFLLSRFYQQQILSFATGSAQLNYGPTHLRQMFIVVPPLTAQRAIASVLGSLDNKIELNRRMNRTLEQMAAAIFKAWFVDFEPVRAKASGAASFPGMPQPVFDALPDSFTDSELGPIPEGWEAGCIGDIGKNRKDGIKPDEIDPETPYIGLEHMPKRSIALDAWEGAAKVTSNKSAFSRGEILFGKLRPYFHKVGVAPVDGVCSTDVLVVKPKADQWSAMLLGHLSSLDFVNYTDACSTGTKMPRTNWKDMSRYPIAVPPKPVAAEATRLMGPIVEQILSNIHESRTLAETRDVLLPKLLSGEVRVGEFAKETRCA
ncbi:MAG: restriction endonuclease subunit S [Phycisphaerales bacterium]